MNDLKFLKNSEVLILEDEPMISMDIAMALKEAGADATLEQMNAQDAMVFIDEKMPDAAILDYDLGKETAMRVAERLNRAKVPFVFYTAIRDLKLIEEALPGVIILKKPASHARLVKALDGEMRKKAKR